MSASVGCKLFGAYRTVISIKDAAVLIHSTVGCNWGTNTFHIPSRQKDIRQASSVLYEEDIVYGGRASLEKALGHMLELYSCSAVFVLTGCVAEIMEDDVESILRNFSSSKPLLLVKAAGFKGNMASGIQDAMKILVDQMDEKRRKENSINLIGMLSDDFRSDADLKAIRRLLGTNIELNSVIPYDDYAGMLNAPAASLNVIFEGFEAAGIQMERKFGIPYIVVNYPYGMEGSKDFAVKVADALKQGEMDFLRELEKETVGSLEMAYGYLHKLYGMPAAVSGDSARAKALKRFLENEMGMNVEAFRDVLNGDNASGACGMNARNDTGRVRGMDDRNDMDGFERTLEKSNAVIVFGSSFERGIAEHLNIPLIRYTYPVFDSINIGNRSYAGFEGTVNLLEDMVNTSMTMKYRRNGMYGD